MTINDQIKAIVIDRTGMDSSEVQDDTDLTESGIDSLESVEILLDLEHTFEIDIDDTEYFKLKTIRELTDYIKSSIKE